jgi:hypothetical protein
MLMDIDNEMIDFTIKYSVFHWHSLESYGHFQNLVEYLKYVAFYTLFTNVISSLLLFLLAQTRLTSTSAPTVQMWSFDNPGHLSHTA